MRRVILLFAFSVLAAIGGLVPVRADSGGSPQTCAVCHAPEFSAWAVSAHADAGGSETFHRLVDAGASLQKDWAETPCLGCHAPTGLADAGGVTCRACHLVESVEGVGNGALHAASDGVLRGRKNTQSPHPTIAADWLSDSLFCAACHEQYHPVTGVPLQTTYSEWLNSPSRSAGKTCQDCHMRGAGAVTHGTGSGDTAAKARALGQAISLDVQPPEPVRAGGHVTLAARLLNHGAGHALPTSKNESGELWLELSATTADGTVLYKDSLAYSVVYNDVEGKHDSPLSLWDAASLFNDRRLMPGLASEEQFAFVVPIDVRGDVKVDVALMYRDVPAWLSEQLSLPQADASVIRRTAVTLQVLEPLPVPTYVAATPAPTPMPIATDSVGTTSGVKMDDWGWVAPFVGGGAILLMGLAAWALRRRAV